MTIEIKDEHPEKQLFPIEATEFGMVIDDKKTTFKAVIHY
jgi:hypothetical protein